MSKHIAISNVFFIEVHNKVELKQLLFHVSIKKHISTYNISSFTFIVLNS